ncbi:universal stress protein [Puia sp. P3]|uniref:universal stress protein n=1 Tax=Puia sp. P3 TaxID=3423952 RepID=UPI003D6769EB
MRTLVVPVDGSENSITAAHYAADLALAIDADIHLLHVVQIVTTPSIMPAGYMIEDMEKAGATLLERISADLKERTHGQADVKILLEVGNIESKITDTCRRIRPFAVVMGAPGNSFSGVLSGSPAVNAARRLPRPVLVIPGGAAFRRIRTVVLACQVKDIAGEIPLTAAFLLQLKELFDSRFDILHVETDTDTKEGLQSFGLYRWQRALEAANPALHFVHSASVSEGVDKYLAENNADWLMLFPKKHSLLEFHKSRSKQLILHLSDSRDQPLRRSPHRTRGRNTAGRAQYLNHLNVPYGRHRFRSSRQRQDLVRQSTRRPHKGPIHRLRYAAHIDDPRYRIHTGRKTVVYSEMLRKTLDAIHRENADVVLDGTFYQTAIRRRFKAGLEDETPLYFIEITADQELIRQRLQRPREDSRADARVYEQLAAGWQPEEEEHLILESRQNNLGDMLRQAMHHLNIVFDQKQNPCEK